MVCYNEFSKGSVPTGNFAEPRLTSGAFAFLTNLGRYARAYEHRIAPLMLFRYSSELQNICSYEFFAIIML